MEIEDKGIGRRGLLQLLPATFLAKSVLGDAAHCGTSTAAKQKGPYQFVFFTPEEVALVDMLMEKIIPADDHSPGAHEARVVEFADLMISESASYVQEDWRNAIRLVASELKQGSAEAWLEAASQQEHDPQTVLDLFFRTLKQMTINGYYSSATGIHQEMQYQGNTYVAAFAGCDHPEHKS